MPVIWRPQMSTGNDLIDLDHKYLLALFNSIELALSKPELLHYLPLFFRQLLDYTKEHFGREERLQLKIDYPGYMEHKLLHQGIVTKLEALYAKVQEELGHLDADPTGDTGHPTDDPAAEPTNDLPPPADAAALRQRLETDVLALAREWVIDHVVKADRAMRPYLATHPRNFA